MLPNKQITDQFWAEDETGQRYRIIATQTVYRSETLEDIAQYTGGTEYKILDAGWVNDLGDDTFQIVGTDTRIRRIR